MVGIYPFLGGNNTLNQLNLKESSLTVYPASFTGSWSSSFSGSRSNTTASFVTLTGLTPSTYYPSINTQSFHMAYLSYDTPSNSGSLMGATNQVIASGGQVFDMSGSRFHVFTASANLTVTQGGPIQAFVVAGGGGAGNDNSGGGGAGGVVYSSSLSITSGVIPATVGTGGLGIVTGISDQRQGQNSTFGSVVAIGGGRGGQNSAFNGGSGGSGGGGALGGFLAGVGTPGQGNSGSNSGGGGGAGTSGSGKDGGSGSFYSQYASLGFGSPAGWFGGGGGFGGNTGGGVGGIGGGGNGANGTGQSGSTNTGGGGGGSTYPIVGGSGGSGIVILSYPINTGSVLLNATPSDISGSINNTDVNGFFAGGPLGLVMTSRTGSRAYSVSKNKVIFNYTSSASSSISNNILLNAVNVNGTASFPSQNNVAYASVGAGLTNDESRTYYDLVDTFQTNLGRVKSTNPNAFITLWDTRLTGSGTSDSSSIIFNIDPYTSYTTSFDWGDGTSNTYQYNAYAWPTISHSYVVPGRYLVTQTGTQRPSFTYNPDPTNKLIDVAQWGNAESIGGFLGNKKIVGTAADKPRNLIDLGLAFQQSGYKGYIGDWNTNNVESLQQVLFQLDDSSTLAYQNLGAWNVEKVTTMNRAFSYTYFNNGGSPDINNWRPISCSNFNGTFGDMYAFNQPIGNWPLSASNINMSSMLSQNYQFNQDLGSWDVSRVTSMYYMFWGSTSFNNSGSSRINNWRPISCSNFESMFSSATAFNQPIGNWTLSASNINMSSMFRSATSFNQNIGSWDVSKVTAMNGMFQSATAFNNSGSNTINNWRPISCSNFSSMFEGATVFNQPIGNWPISASSVNMSFMFRSANGFNQNISSWNTSTVTNMNNMFLQAGAFNQPIGSWNTSAVTNMSGMFNQASSFNQNIGSWNVSNVTSFEYMFYFINFNNGGSSDINNWVIKTAGPVNMSGMFNYAGAFNQPIGSWNTSAVTTMSDMFDNANAFNQDIGSWNVGNVTNFTGFMTNKATYSFLHTIYDGWINNKLQPQRTISFGTIKYSGSAAEGRALLTRTYNTASITGYSDDGGFMAITCSANHSVIVGNKVFISGSSFSGVNGVETVLVAGSPTTLTLNTLYDPTATGGTIITGYGWSITDGGVV
jgi:surface protein